jgi:hypothetical protein
MTYRLIVDGNLYSRRGVFNENLFASAINTSSINAYNNTLYTNSVLTIGNNTKTVNFGIGGDTPTELNINGICNINGTTNIYGNFVLPNTLDFRTYNMNVSIGQNQTAGHINIGNSTVNTIINGNTTTLASNSNNCINAITSTNNANIDFKSYGSTMDYDTRILSNGGNSALNGKGACTIISDSLSLPSNINSNNTNNQINLFTTQTTEGNINMGNSAAGIILNAENTSVIGTKLVIPNNISSNTPTTDVNLFTNQNSSINIGNSNSTINLNGTVNLNGAASTGTISKYNLYVNSTITSLTDTITTIPYISIPVNILLTKNITYNVFIEKEGFDNIINLPSITDFWSNDYTLTINIYDVNSYGDTTRSGTEIRSKSKIVNSNTVYDYFIGKGFYLTETPSYSALNRYITLSNSKNTATGGIKNYGLYKYIKLIATKYHSSLNLPTNSSGYFWRSYFMNIY